MLIDTLVDDRDRDALLPVLEHRAKYLEDRARVLAERPLGGDDWQTTMARASLHLETAEAMATLGRIGDARFAVQLALSDYLALQMPFGAALQRAFVTDHGSLEARTDELVARWTGRESSPRTSDAEAEKRVAGLLSRAAETPQQWAYLAVATALRQGDDGVSREAATALRTLLLDWRTIPIGRLRFPLEHTLAVISTSREGGAEGAVVDILVAQLVATLRAVQYASRNRYLWMRGFAPVPWFDMDLALLIAVASSPDLDDAVVRAMPDDARSYAIEYLATVNALRGARPRSETPSYRSQ